MARGWLMRMKGEIVEVPEFLLDHEELAYPWALQEQEPGSPVQLTDQTFYRRHEILPGEAFLYLRDGTALGRIEESVIRRLLGASAIKRPTRFPVELMDLRALKDGLGERTLERHAGCVLVIPSDMWETSPKDLRSIFHNLCRVEDVQYEVQMFAGERAFWLFKESAPA
jgi:hypothetical protein